MPNKRCLTTCQNMPIYMMLLSLLNHKFLIKMKSDRLLIYLLIEHAILINKAPIQTRLIHFSKVTTFSIFWISNESINSDLNLLKEATSCGSTGSSNYGLQAEALTDPLDSYPMDSIHSGYPFYRLLLAEWREAHEVHRSTLLILQIIAHKKRSQIELENSIKTQWSQVFDLKIRTQSLINDHQYQILNSAHSVCWNDLYCLRLCYFWPVVCDCGKHLIQIRIDRHLIGAHTVRSISSCPDDHLKAVLRIGERYRLEPVEDLQQEVAFHLVTVQLEKFKAFELQNETVIQRSVSEHDQLL